MTILIGKLGSDSSTLAVAAALWFVGLLLVAFIVVRTVQRVRQVWTAVAYLETARDASDFARQFKFISHNIETLHLLAGAWARFKPTVILPQLGAGPAKLRCTAQPADCFAYRRVTSGWPDLRVLPSIFLCFALLLSVAGVSATVATSINAVAERAALAKPTVKGAVDSGPKLSASDKQSGETGQTASAGSGSILSIAHDKSVQYGTQEWLAAGQIGFVTAASGLLIALILTAVSYAGSAMLKSALLAFSGALQSRIEVVSLDAVVLERIQAVSSARAEFERSTQDPAGQHVLQRIEQIILPHIDAAIARVHDRLDRTVWESATTNSASARGLADEIGKLIDRRVAEPALGVAEVTRERLAYISRQLSGLTTLGANGNRPSLPAPLRDAATALSDDPELVGSSKKRLDDGSNHGRFEVASLSHLNELGDRIAGSLETAVSHPLQNMADTVAALECAVLQMQTAITTAHAGVQDAAPIAAKPEWFEEFRSLLTAVAKGNSEIGNVTKSASERIACTLLARIEADIAQPMRVVSNDMREMRSALEMADAKIAQMQLAGSVQSNQVKSDSVALREAIEASNQRVVNDTRSAVRSVENSLLERIDASADSLRSVARIVSDVSESIVGLDKALCAADPFATVLKSFDDQGAHLGGQIAAVLAAIRDGNDAVAQKHLETKDALAIDFAWNERFEENVATTLLALTESVTGIREALTVAEQRAAQSDSGHTGSMRGIVNDLRIATDGLGETVSGMMSRSHADAELIGQTLNAQLEKTADALGRATKNIEHSSAELIVSLRGIVDQAPDGIARETESAASVLHAAVTVTREQLGQTLASLADAKARDDAQVAVALAKINEMLAVQAEFKKHVSDLSGFDVNDPRNKLEGNVLWDANRASSDVPGNIAGRDLHAPEKSLQTVGVLSPAMTHEAAATDADPELLHRDQPSPIELLKTKAGSSPRVSIRK